MCCSLANVLLQSPAVTPGENQFGKKEADSLPGLMSYMSQNHIQTLLSCLDLSYEGAIEFDSRPGLKFLVQKVAGLDRAANLYRQAGAAWTLKVVTLFDLCLHEVDRSGATLDKVKEIMENEEKSVCEQKVDSEEKETDDEGIMQKPSKSADYDYHDMSTFLKRLRQSFDKLCDTYIDIVLDKDGAHSAVDRISDQPIFFLIAQTDDFPDIKLKDIPITMMKNDGETVEETISEPTKENNVKKQKGKDVETVENNSEVTTSNSKSESDSNKKPQPFMFSDFANQYNDSKSEDDPDEENLCKQSNEPVFKSDVIGNDVDNLMDEYKRRKQQMCGMPPQPGHWEKRRNPFTTVRKTSTSDQPGAPSEPLPPDIEQQRKNSFCKVS